MLGIKNPLSNDAFRISKNEEKKLQINQDTRKIVENVLFFSTTQATIENIEFNKVFANYCSIFRNLESWGLG